MKITNITCHRRDFVLRQTSRVAYSAIDVAPNVIVKIETDEGLIGWGNAAPDEFVTSETAESVKQTIEASFRPLLLNAEPNDVEGIFDLLRQTAPRQFAAIAAIDIALYDLVGKKINKPVYEVAQTFSLRDPATEALRINRLAQSTNQGRLKLSVASLITLSIDQPENMLARAKSLVIEGWPALKIKCGLDAEKDAELIRSIREAVGNQVKLTVDANQGYDLKAAQRFCDAIAPDNIEFIEQPIPANDLAALAQLARTSPLPVMADEIVLDAADLRRVIDIGGIKLVNIKLMKAGGLTGARRCLSLLEAAGMTAMIGCMDETRISMAAAAHLAASSPVVGYADLDGHLDIIDDIATGGLEVNCGQVEIFAQAGLGVEARL